MTIKEAGKDYGIAMYYTYDEDSDSWGWSWAVECGYQCWDGIGVCQDPSECQEKLKDFLKTWEGPTK